MYAFSHGSSEKLGLEEFFARAQPCLDGKYISELDRQSRPDNCRRFWIYAARAAMGHPRRYANKMNLITMMPHPDLASTRYALARPGSEYLVYQPQPHPLHRDVTQGTYSYEWFNAVSGAVVTPATSLSTTVRAHLRSIFR